MGKKSGRSPSAAKHVCIIYDCLFPYTIGGAERWYRVFAERLVREGHRVTYLTLQQWDDANRPKIEGVEVVAVGPRLDLYRGGNRRIWPPLRFGWGVFLHMLYNARRYSHVHLASFPYFSLLAVGLLKPFARYSLGVDWFEVWSRDYWRGYLGFFGGWLGWAVQRICSVLPQQAFVFSRLHQQRLLAFRREATLLSGLYSGADHLPIAQTNPPTFIYAGRMIPEKRVPFLIDAFALVHAQRPDLKMRLFGNGPDRSVVAKRIGDLGLEDAVTLSGFVEQGELDAALAGALAIVQPSMREGYGMVVVEANARGVPAIVVEAEDNAAVELIQQGVNGEIAAANRASLAEAMLKVATHSESYRVSAKRWFAENRTHFSAEMSINQVLQQCNLVLYSS